MNALASTGNYNVESLADRIKNNRLDNTKVLRTDGWWTATDDARFIESLLMGLPTPAMYVIEAPHRWIMLDGRQRFHALAWFVNHGGRLRGLEHLVELEGKSFTELPEATRRQLLAAEVPVHLLDLATPTGTVRALFDRITGSEPKQTSF